MIRALKIIVFVVLVLSLAGLGYDAATMPRHSGPVTERFNGKTFFSQSYENKQATDLLKWSTNRQQGPWEQRATRPAEHLLSRVHEGLHITLVNHSTLLIQVDGLNLLTDPIWSNSTGPFGRIGPSRFRQPGIEFNALPPIDVVFVSHSHYDHMDLPTLKRLHERDQPRFVAGLGNAGNLAKVGIDNVIELDWWQSVALNGSLELIMTPAEHWSKRSVLDTNRTLWGGFVLNKDDEAMVFFAGDTGAGEHFNHVFERYGAVSVALLPIGAYLPRWFMQDNHLSPSEALEAAAMLRSDVMIPIHFGTFALGDDGQDQPLVDLLAVYKAAPPDAQSHTHDSARNVRPTTPQLRVLDNGQTATLTQ